MYRKIFGQRRIPVRTKFDVLMMLDPAEYVDDAIITDGYWEPEVLEAIRAALREGDVFWDIGGNLGTHSLTIKKLDPSVRVIAFEPNPIMHGLLTTHARINALDLHVHPFGLSDTPGEAEFFVYTGLNYGKSGLRAPPEKALAMPIKVKLMTGDELVREMGVPPPNVIKIDVEGHELSVFRGLTDVLQGTSLRAIVFEDPPVADSPVKKFLEAYGFRIRELASSSYFSHTDYGDYIAERETHCPVAR
jgi:FkbM family methyltransferase